MNIIVVNPIFEETTYSTAIIVVSVGEEGSITEIFKIREGSFH